MECSTILGDSFHDKHLTIVMFISGEEFPFLNGVDSKTVVPVAAGEEEFVVGREDKEVGGDGHVLGKRASHTLPLGPVQRGNTSPSLTEY